LRIEEQSRAREKGTSNHSAKGEAKLDRKNPEIASKGPTKLDENRKKILRQPRFRPKSFVKKHPSFVQKDPSFVRKHPSFVIA